ncbi:hypothetical protein [Mycobacteroides abscessus]|uniref:hypothetical protein n=1 Tax=Mycobacteroides abscessus TaxID=36809 RepID=UPI001F1BFB8F|nr:hypothetical protein [Mycobacteroides abscessus]
MNPRIAVALATVAALLAAAACGQNSTPPASSGSASSTTSPTASVTSGSSPHWISPAPTGALASPTHGYIPSLTSTPGTLEGQKVSIPTLSGGDPAVTKRFNESMKASRAGMPLASEEISVNDGELPGGYRSGVTRIGAGAVAGRIVLLWYGKGAAHPNRSLGTVVIATTTATPITVDDLYRDRSAALDRLRSLLPELDATKRVDPADVTGTDFADTWLPTSAGLEVYVPVAHAAGDYVPVMVPWARIAAQLRPGMLERLRAD